MNTRLSASTTDLPDSLCGLVCGVASAHARTPHTEGLDYYTCIQRAGKRKNPFALPSLL